MAYQKTTAGALNSEHYDATLIIKGDNTTYTLIEPMEVDGDPSQVELVVFNRKMERKQHLLAPSDHQVRVWTKN